MEENQSNPSGGFKNKLRAFLRESAYFLTSGLFLKNFAMLIGAVILLVLITWLWLGFHTDHGESVEVGKYIGLDVDNAIKQAAERNIKITVTDSIYVFGKEGGTVQDQNPRPGARVKENRVISLITYKHTETAKLPRLKGNYDFERYKRSLNIKDFELTIAEKVFDPKQAANTVLYLLHDGKKITEDNIEKGIELKRGTKLEAVVTKRNSDYIPVPDLVCKTYGEAEFLVQSARLTISEVVGSVTDLNAAHVYQQEPDSNKSLRVGEAVKIYVTEQRPAGCQ